MIPKVGYRCAASTDVQVSLWRCNVQMHAKSECSKRLAAGTYNFLSLLNTRLDPRNVSRRLIIIKLLNLMLAQHRYVLLRRQFPLAKALGRNALCHFISEIRFRTAQALWSCARDERALQKSLPGNTTLLGARWPLRARAAAFRDKNASQHRRYGCQITRTLRRTKNRDGCDGL
jgi:hypothetical protein